MFTRYGLEIVMWFTIARIFTQRTVFLKYIGIAKWTAVWTCVRGIRKIDSISWWRYRIVKCCDTEKVFVLLLSSRNFPSFPVLISYLFLPNSLFSSFTLSFSFILLCRPLPFLPFSVFTSLFFPVSSPFPLCICAVYTHLIIPLSCAISAIMSAF